MGITITRYTTYSTVICYCTAPWQNRQKSIFIRKTFTEGIHIYADFSITEHLAVSILLCTVFGPTKSSLKYAIDGKSRITVY
jgi:hypothetical protein